MKLLLIPANCKAADLVVKIVSHGDVITIIVFRFPIGLNPNIFMNFCLLNITCFCVYFSVQSRRSRRCFTLTPVFQALKRFT